MARATLLHVVVGSLLLSACVGLDPDEGLEAEKGFHRLKGHKGMPTLVAALRRNDAQIDGDDSAVDGQMEAA